MKKLLIGAAIAIVGATGAQAADIAARPYTKAPAMVAAYNWSGFYAGVHAGAIWQNTDQTTTIDPGAHIGIGANIAAINAAGVGGNDRTNFIGGGQIGYNWQAPGSAFVWGLEADFSGISNSNNGRSVTALLPANAPSTFTLSSSSSFDWLATIRGRLGYAFGSSMIYATGGLAIAELNVSSSYTDNLAGPYFGAGSNSVTKAGWTVGAGWEHAIAASWTVKAEYLYVHFDGVGVDYTATLVGGGSPNNLHSNASFNDNHIVRLGLNYKFGGPAVAY